MKQVLGLIIIGFLTSSSSDCGRKQKQIQYQGRLEIKAICSNYTISVVSGNMDTSFLESSWTDENTKKSYKNVFALGNPCDFPSTINQGDTFYFTIDTSKSRDCMVCMAYYPKPSRKININVLTP